MRHETAQRTRTDDAEICTLQAAGDRAMVRGSEGLGKKQHASIEVAAAMTAMRNVDKPDDDRIENAAVTTAAAAAELSFSADERPPLATTLALGFQHAIMALRPARLHAGGWRAPAT